ncbi:hypothetical protein IMZ08_17380 [Bacillus luteolus]|uniref:Uncharacterized protein n=1 Tax=Litchfieldia luteola TaxID=682179 RepID=A0ABR9QNR4_9BACI|nr:hypothetical protein [Cytobacillus luteolus]MBE4909809.1 hypothetical protein [Cytobacillus luteolus]MBP1942642.1 ABC-type antimicrobial peptide transport system permease subunit [Cytobacillus luteolus]
MGKGNILFYILSVVFFYLYFKVLGFVWNVLPVGVSGISSLISFVIIFLVVLPLALVSAQKLTKIIIPKR